MTVSELCAVVSATTGQPVDPNIPVFDQGLTSLGLIQVIEQLQAQGQPADFFSFSMTPTISGWAEVLGVSNE